MIRTFADKTTADIFAGIHSKDARKIPQSLHIRARNKLFLIDFATTADDLRIPPGNRLEKLSGDLEGFYSIRINEQYRIMFRWESGHAESVQIIDYH